jgi:CubicO group peptidase (beta-lactamase class C family)
MTVELDGWCAPGWGGVRDALAANLRSGADLGASVCAFHRGECTVDLAGGWADRARTVPYRRSTLQVVFSTTKGVVATALAMCVQRGLLGYRDRVAEVWPEFAARGKHLLEVRDVMSHRAGLEVPEGAMTLPEALDWEAATARVAASAPRRGPDDPHGYHAITFGWLAGEILRRVDGRSIGDFVAEEVAGPLGADIWIGLPERMEPRVAPLVAPRLGGADGAAPLDEVLTVNGALAVKGGFNRRELRAAQIPGANGVANARGVATMYAASLGEVGVDGRSIRLLDDATRLAATSPATRPGARDAVLGVPTSFSQGGYMLAGGAVAYRRPAAYGHPGAGGSVGFADPDAGLAFSYVMNAMGAALTVDPRADALVAAAYAAIG